MNLKRILIIRTGALGDVILTLPILQTLAKEVPSASIELLGNPSNLSIAKNYSRRIYDINLAEWAPFFVSHSLLPEKVVKRLKATDLVISYLPDANGVFATNLRRSGVRTVISFPPHPPLDGSIHIVDHLLQPLAKLHMPIATTQPNIILKPEDHLEAFQTLKDKGLDRKIPPLIFHPGSGSTHKCWPPERFAGIGNYAVQKTGLPLLLLSGPADGNLVHRIASYMQSPVTIIHPASITHLAALLKCAAVYLGNDSGPTHLAAAVRVPVVVLFGPTNPQIWAPRGVKIKVLGDPKIVPKHRLQGISEATVLQAIFSLLPP